MSKQGAIMRSIFLRGLMLLAAVCMCSLASRSAVAQSMGMDAMLKQTGYAYTTHNATTWSVDLNRKNIGKIRVILSTGSDIVVTFVIVAKQAAIQKTPQMLNALLTANNDYDYAKIGLDKDGDLFVRIDTLLRTIDAPALKDVITQVANASDELYPKISAWIKK
jgi:hypothetical protein